MDASTDMTPVEETPSHMMESINPSIDTTAQMNPAHFTAEDEDPTNIWKNVDEDESDTPAFLRRKKKQEGEK